MYKLIHACIHTTHAYTDACTFYVCLPTYICIHTHCVHIHVYMPKISYVLPYQYIYTHICMNASFTAHSTTKTTSHHWHMPLNKYVYHIFTYICHTALLLKIHIDPISAHTQVKHLVSDKNRHKFIGTI